MDFWKRIREWDVIFFIETWVDEKEWWEKIRGKLPMDYRWEVQYARRQNRKGRAIGGLMLGIRKEIETEDLNQGEEKEGIMGKVMKLGEEKWRLIGVYVREDGVSEEMDGRAGRGNEDDNREEGF